MRHVPGSAAIYRSGLALLISALTFWFSEHGLSAADQGKPPQLAQTQQPLLGQTSPLVGTPSGSVFLKGTYIELGMHTLGSFGAEDPARFAGGFHPLELLNGTTSGTLGFIYNPLGWVSSTDRPTDSGDFFVPGVPEEVWGVSWNYGASNENTVRYMNAGLADQSNTFARTLVAQLVDAPNSIAKALNFPQDISSGNDRRSLWQGSVTHSALINQRTVSESLRITQTVHFDVSDKFFVVNVILKNVGTTTIHGLKYLRSVDPDQEAGAPVNGVSGATNNYVSFQPPRGVKLGFPSDNTSKALVVAKGPTKGVTLGLGAIDSRARVAYSTTNATSPLALFQQIRDPLGVLQLGTNADGIVMADSARAATPAPADGAISLAFDLGDVPADQSAVIDYVYLVNESDFYVALGTLKSVSIALPTGTISGSNVSFQATVKNKAAVTKVDFFAAGLLVGTDTTATGLGTYDITFDTSSLTNGSLSLEAVATYADLTTSRAATTVTVANSGPTIAFGGSTPADGATVSGSAVPVELSYDVEFPPAQVRFYRVVNNVATLLTTPTQTPFATSFTVAGLADGTSVIIRAVASDGNTASTTITRTFVSSSGSQPVVTPVTAPVIPLSQGDAVIYTAVSPSTAEGKVSLLAALSGNNPLITRAFSWDSTIKSYVELPAQPAGGIQITSGIFIATRVPLSFTLSGTASVAPENVTIRHAGWTFAGIPPVEVTTGTYATSFIWPGSAVVSPAVGLTITYPSSGTVTLAEAMGDPLGDPSTSRPWFWNGSDYVQVDTLESGKGYWFKNNLDSEDITMNVPSLAGSPTLRAVAKNSASSSAFRDQGTPPPPPSGVTKAASSSSGGCGVGSGLASFAFFLLLFGCRFFVARR